MNDRFSFRFRVWDKEINAYLKPVKRELEGVEHDLFITPDGAAFSDLQYCINRPDGFIVEQCTGLKDKHGRLIYEGDVITVDSSTININDTQAIVFWDEYEASFNLQWLPQGNGANALKRIKKLYKHGVGDTRWWEVEVVGNIHENAELLEGGK